ncbi:hypothetical protein GQ53DRAFT_749516 [Thozetella sp. PMI_491]|nr:hypothetical protein GQ53DRAFT_749516 [Thozetella sp. PMI_491]
MLSVAHVPSGAPELVKHIGTTCSAPGLQLAPYGGSASANSDRLKGSRHTSAARLEPPLAHQEHYETPSPGDLSDEIRYPLSCLRRGLAARASLLLPILSPQTVLLSGA